jgi:hypothetical protein
MTIPSSALRMLTASFVLAACWGTASAGDHQDGSQVRDEQSGDIGGLWAFMPDRGDQAAPLVVAMGIRPFAVNRSEIGSDYDYSFRIRPAALDGVGARLRSWVGASELRVTCRFNRTRQVVCDMMQVSASGASNSEGGVAGDFGKPLRSLGRGMAVFADLRTDPYMANIQAIHECMDNGEVAFRAGEQKIRNSFADGHINTIGLIVEIHPELLPKSNGLPLLAVAAESVLVTDGGERRIDRVGRSETSVFLIQDDAKRNAWNSHGPFASDGTDAFRDEMQRGMTGVDAFSRKGYGDYPHPLLNVMLEDYLLLNPTNPVDPLDTKVNHYMELEWAAFNGQSTAALSGGRRLTDNSVARFFSIFARQGKSSFAHLDALRQPLFRPTHATFPYMSGPLARMEGVLASFETQLHSMHGAMVGCE